MADALLRSAKKEWGPLDKRLEDWCARVCGQVRFGPDRAAVREELEAHVQDHCDTLIQLGYEETLAAERTLAAMGDADTVGRALDRVHHPFWGWLWMLSRIAVGLAALAALVSLAGMPPSHTAQTDMTREQYAAYGGALDPASTDEGRTFLGYGAVPEPVIACGYTISAPYAVWWQEGEDRCHVQVVLAADTPWPWNQAPWSMAIGVEAVDSLGNVYPSHTEDGYRRGGVKTDEVEIWQTYFHFLYSEGVTTVGCPDWIELRYSHGDRPWTLRIEREVEA